MTFASERLEYALSNYKKSFFLVEFLGLDFTYLENACISKFEVEETYFGPQKQSYENGLLTTIMDITMAYFCKSQTGFAGATIELTSKYIRPLTSGPALCRANFVGLEPKSESIEAHIRDSDDRLVSYGTATWKISK